MTDSNQEHRKPVAMTVDPQKGRIHVACDDGTVWVNKGSFGWSPLDPIPGTRADRPKR